MLSDAIHTLMIHTGIYTTQITSACVGMPVVEESPGVYEEVMNRLQRLLPRGVKLYGDAYTCRAGSLAGEDGINVIAGTGSVCSGAYQGRYARCGGYSASLGDEGSCHWVARKTIEVFIKQADARLKKTVLYDEMHRYFETENDNHICANLNRELYFHRDQMALLQMVTAKSFEKGDPHAQSIYQSAAREMSFMAQTVRIKLETQATLPVSYSGGLFQTPGVIELFRQAVDLDGLTFQMPRFSPVQGALILAAQSVLSPPEIMRLLTNLASEETLNENR
jgi:N-acetylglucosamine kinase-like BadF-type ATPase